MIIKSHVRGGFTAAAAYLGAAGANESIRSVEFNDHGAGNLGEAFSNMWAVARTTRAAKPLHHVSINPHKDERLTDAQVLKICALLEEKYGYVAGEHQRVIVEHVKDGRQHFHVMWNRVNLKTGRPIWPGHHWNKSRQASREIEVAFGLKRPTPRRAARERKKIAVGRRATRARRASRRTNRHETTPNVKRPGRARVPRVKVELLPAWSVAARWLTARSVCASLSSVPRHIGLRILAAQTGLPAPLRPAPLPRRHRRAALPPLFAMEPTTNAADRARSAAIQWAWANGRWDVLALYGIYVPLDL